MDFKSASEATFLGYVPFNVLNQVGGNDDGCVWVVASGGRLQPMSHFSIF